ncbi:MAG: acyl-CoA dehydrogenase family protein [Patulibacter sp.]|nr:acyl-CoA dehydrogenase family protein [Patulibacter sp.]
MSALEPHAVRAVLDALLPRRTPGATRAVLGAGIDVDHALTDGRAFLGSVAEHGWGTPRWPREHGGAGLDEAGADRLQTIVAEYERPDLYPFLIGLSMVGPILIAHGTADQQRRHLDPIRRGDEVWCQLFSEPEAGSDLAALRTRAVRDGDGWRIDGHKLWVSRAAFAAFGLLLARTGPVEAKHAGITAFVLPMDAPGVRIEPIAQMNRDEHFYEVRLEDVRLPDANRIGPVDGGWRVAMSTLERERASVADAGVGPEVVVALLREHGAVDDPAWTSRAASALVAASLPAIGAEVGRPVGGKLLLAAAGREIAALARDLRGPAAAVEGGPWSTLDLTAPSLSIRGGTDEIQLNVIAERTLGLPREPRAS